MTEKEGAEGTPLTLKGVAALFALLCVVVTLLGGLTTLFVEGRLGSHDRSIMDMGDKRWQSRELASQVFSEHDRRMGSLESADRDSLAERRRLEERLSALEREHERAKR